MHLILPLIERPKDPAVCRVLAGVIGVVETILPRQVHSYYLVGSHVHDAALPTSDIDLTIIFKQPLAPLPLRGMQDVLRCCSKISPFPIDVKIRTLAEVDAICILDQPILLYGPDLRSQLPVFSPEQSLRAVMIQCFNEVAAILDEARPLPLPAVPPDPTDRFLGMVRRLVREADGSEQPGLKWLAASIIWPAKALILARSGRWILGKGEPVIETYRSAVGGPFVDIVAAANRRLWRDWLYRVPSSEAERDELRRICQDSLAFFTFFLREYRQFWLTQTHTTDAQVDRLAAHHLGDIVP